MLCWASPSTIGFRSTIQDPISTQSNQEATGSVSKRAQKLMGAIFGICDDDKQGRGQLLVAMLTQA